MYYLDFFEGNHVLLNNYIFIRVDFQAVFRFKFEGGTVKITGRPISFHQKKHVLLFLITCTCLQGH